MSTTHKLPDQSVPKRARNQRGEGGRLRGEVIDAAMRLLDRAPAKALSLRLVAKEAGVAPPSLYRQFADSEAMMRAIIVECWWQVASEMLKACIRAADEPPIRQLQAEMGAFVRYAMQRPSRYQLLFALPAQFDEEPIGPLRPAYRVVLETIERHVAEGGQLPVPGSPATAILVISMAHGRIALAHLAPARRGNFPAEIEQFIASTLDRLLDSAQLVRAVAES